jgi:hypothetical protein
MQITIKLDDNTAKPIHHLHDLKTVIQHPAKKDENHKFNAHVVCIVIGIVITVACTFFNTALILHVSGILATLPAFIQEAIDWIRNW